MLFGRKLHEVSSDNIFSMLNEGMVSTLCMLSNVNSTTSFNESCFKVSSNFLPHLMNILENLIYISGMSISGCRGLLLKHPLINRLIRLCSEISE